jgi:hypothetical protein
MFRSLFRRPRTVAVPAHNGTVEFQRVAVRRQPSKTSAAVRRFVVNAVLFYCAFRTIEFWMYGPSPEVLKQRRESSKTQSKPSDHWKEQHAAIHKQEDSGSVPKADASDRRVVIPIYGWLRESPRSLYKPTDPEWKAWMALRSDQKAQDALKASMTKAMKEQLNRKIHQFNLQSIESTKQYTVELHIGRIVRPPTYAMRCVVIEPDGIGLGWKQLDDLEGARLQRLKQPLYAGKAVLSGVWAFATTTAAISRARLLDFVYPEFERSYQLVYGTVNGNRVLQTAQLSQRMSREQIIIRHLPTSNLSEENAAKLFPFLKGASGQSSAAAPFKSFVQFLTNEHALQHAQFTSRSELINSTMRDLKLNTPGAVPVVGEFMLLGRKGRYRIEIEAVYLPRDGICIGKPTVTRAAVLYDFDKPKEGQKTVARSAISAAPSSEETTSKQPSPESEAPEKDTPPNGDAGK